MISARPQNDGCSGYVVAALAVSLLIVAYLSGCAVVADWLAEPVGEPAPGGEGSSGALGPGAAPAPTQGDAVVGGASAVLGVINPFWGMAAGSLGRLGLGWMSQFRSK
ncbi:MAG: hypothetical protein DRJ50_13525 [Actinobacteria bacterium]|nr:MAG: hypothetical protein DRJ50_13525 [Actinomycetota bacterium]